MTTQDRPEFAKALAVLAETYGEQVSRLRLEAYFDALCDLPLDGIRAAIRQHVKASRWFPKPAELRAFFPSVVPEAGEAFAQLCQAMCQPEAYFGRPSMPAYLLTTVDRMGGWMAVSRMDRDTLQRRFTAVYEPVRARAVVTSGDARQLEQQPDRERIGQVRGLIGEVLGG